MVIAPATKPEKPEMLAVLFRVRRLPLTASAIVKVPVPERVPLTIRSTTVPLLIVGLLPSGKLQSLLTVFVLVWLKVTKLKVALLQDKVPVDPSNVTVPPLALNVVPEFRVKLLAKVAMPDGALNTPLELKVNVLLKSAPLGTVNVPLFWMVTAPAATKVL